MSRRAAINRSTEAKSWHLMRPLKSLPLRSASEANICKETDERVCGKIGNWIHKSAAQKKNFLQIPNAIERAIFNAIDKQTWKWNSKVRRGRRVQRNAARNFLHPRAPVYSWTDIPHSQRHIGLHSIRPAPFSQQFHAGTEVVIETLQKANCHPARITFRVVER